MDNPAYENFLWFLLSEVEIILYRVTSALQRPSTSFKSNNALNEHCVKLRAAKSKLQQGLREILANQDVDTSFGPEDFDDTRELLQQAISLEELTSTEASRREPEVYDSPPQTEKSLRMVGGKWTQMFANHSMDPKEKLTTAVGRLKRDYDQQVRNILLLERERNQLEVKVMSLENQLQRAQTSSKGLSRSLK